MSEHNLLRGAQLEDEFVQFRDHETIRVPQGWGPWWVPPSDRPSDPAWQNHVPVFDTRYIDGRMVAQVSTPYATHTAGYLQQVPVVAGEKYEFVASALAWSSEAAEDGEIREGSDVNLQIGVDPTGGLDGESPIIQWCQPSQAVGKWETLRLMFTAQASIVTVFLKSAPFLPKRQQTIFWRNGELMPLGRYKRATNVVGAGDTHISLEPERPQFGETVLIQISSQRPQRHSALHIYAENRDLVRPEFHGRRQADDRYEWRYSLTLEQEGLYDIRFVGDNGARLLAQRLVQAVREVQIVPSGAPRLDYRRTYVLLPPTADETWFAAAARGSFSGRYTVGFSADDAGIGEVRERHVIAVNPHHWPETLTSAWYQHHYPGTTFEAVVANSAADLEAWLREQIYV